jgi:hypothetical protein
MSEPVLHPGLTVEKWAALSIFEQLGNVGTEVSRAARSKARGDDERLAFALARALELLDLSLADPRWRGPRRREIARTREVVCDLLAGDNEYGSSAASIDAYFLPFAIAARRGR